MRSRGAGVGANRVRIAQILLLIPFLVLAARAANLSIDQRGTRLGEQQTDRVVRLAPERGVITDRNGAELALSVDAPSVYAHPSRIEDTGRIAQLLSKALGSDRQALMKRLAGRRPFAFVSRWVTDEQAKRVIELSLDGVGVLYEPRRVYPYRSLAAQLIGFANIDGIGARGIEQHEDSWLRGSQRHVQVERDARGHLLLNDGDASWDTAGGDIALTIDAAFQADAEAALRDAIAATGGRGGVAISLNPHTGEILALAEAPTFDPNEFRRLDYHATRSRAFLDAADPGSTMKVFLMAAALENGSVEPEQRIECESGSFRVPGSVIHDSHPHEELTVTEILRVSSNIGAVKIAFALGPRAHFEALRSFGFGKVTGVGFPGESSGLLRPWQQWRPLDHATIAFGQGVTVTPIQLAAATAALANGGEWVQPRLVAARRVAGGAWQPEQPSARRRVVKPETAAKLLSMMEGVVGPEGTAPLAALRAVPVAGKTGTAQKFDPEAGTYSDDRFMAWFVGIVPADDPQLVIVAGIDEAKRPLHTGGAAAGPLFARMASAQLARYGIVTEPKNVAPRHTPPIESETPVLVAATPSTQRARADSPATGNGAPAVSAPPLSKAAQAASTPKRRAEVVSPADHRVVSLGNRMLLPDFRGMTPQQVLNATTHTTLAVKMTGSGRAVAQEPAAGTIVAVRQALVFIHFESTQAGGGT